MFPPQMRSRRFVTIILAASVLAIFFLSRSFGIIPIPYRQSAAFASLTPARLELIEHNAQQLVDNPTRPPYKDKFSRLGEQARLVRDWMALGDSLPDSVPKRRIIQSSERAAQSLFPFLRNPPQNPKTETPLSNLRQSFESGTQGIVIPTGGGTLRFASHLIASLQQIHKTRLPIEIAYAGDSDLSPADRAWLNARFSNLKFLDVLDVLDDATLRLSGAGWAIKPFAVLASRFEQVIMLDADAVFLRPPESLFADPSYLSAGTLLFHDRLLWQHAYPDRHEWWRSQIQHPSATLNKSLVWTEDYAEEGDSGVVVANKSDLGVLVALLHVCWQNSAAVREEVTYKLTHGDKESWWLGFELVGSPYAFEEHYGAMVGWPGPETDQKDAGLQRVCSFVIAHMASDPGAASSSAGPLWYNGGLLKNKKTDLETFGVPTHWMVDGKWEKGADRSVMSCMVGKNAVELSDADRETIETSVQLARSVDDGLKSRVT